MEHSKYTMMNNNITRPNQTLHFSSSVVFLPCFPFGVFHAENSIL